MTLFELSVVVAIAIILAILAIMSTQSLITRTKVSRVKEEHRALSRALQNYILDYSDRPSLKQGLARLTHPTAYMGSVPRDPFQDGRGGYLYLSPGSNDIAAILISPGPDGDFDLPDPLWSFTSRQDVVSKMIPPAALKLESDSMPAEVGPDGRRRDPIMSESDAAMLSTYLKLGRYDPEKGEDGDIITVIRY